MTIKQNIQLELIIRRPGSLGTKQELTKLTTSTYRKKTIKKGFYNPSNTTIKEIEIKKNIDRERTNVRSYSIIKHKYIHNTHRPEKRRQEEKEK